MARNKNTPKSTSGRSGGRANRNDVAIDPVLIAYEDRILHPAGGLQTARAAHVLAKNRVELAEALPYFQITEGSTYIEDGIVRGFLLDDELDEDCHPIHDRGYMDAEIVIARIPPPLPWKNIVTGRIHGKTKKKARATLVDHYDAFRSNFIHGHPLILILDRTWSNSIVGKNEDEPPETRYLVLDHFIVSQIWQEPSRLDSSADAHFVRFEKLNLHKSSWWTFPAEHPPQDRNSAAPWLQPCSQCGLQWPPMYTRGWFCLNASCTSFGYNHLGESMLAEDLHFDDDFLKWRHPRTQIFQPTYDLVPNLLGLVESQQQWCLSGQLGSRASSDLWRGIVCSKCHQCVPRIFWHAWKCGICHKVWEYGPALELYQKFDFLQEFGMNQAGHPRVDILCPNDFRLQPPLVRPTYRMDRVFLHGDAFITLLSPTEEFNQAENGPNTIFNELLAGAPAGKIPLRRRRLYPFDKHSGRRTPYFTGMYGEQYDFSKLGSISDADTPDSVRSAETLLLSAAQGEASPYYKDSFNQASVECYFDDMLMSWHTDGDKELGSTIAMLSLGSKAELRVRLKQHIYQNSNLAKVITGSYNWRNLKEVKRLVQAGLDLDGAWNQQPYYVGPATPPEVVLPMIHGSIVIFQGKHFSKYFEHSIENTDNDSGSLRFTVTTRHINAAKHAEVFKRHRYARQAGPKFSFIREPALYPDDDDQPFEGYQESDSDDSDDDDYQDYSTSGSHDAKWPGKRRPRPIRTDALGNPLGDDPAEFRAETAIQRTTRSGRPMRSYVDLVDDDDDDDESAVERGDKPFDPKKKGTSSGTRQAEPGGSRRRGTRATTVERSRSRSPDTTGRATTRGVRDRDTTRGATAPLPGHDTTHAPVTRRPAAAPTAAAVSSGKIDPANKKRHPNSSHKDKILHNWTKPEMDALKKAGQRVTNEKSTWEQEMANLPTGITLQNAKERYGKKFKRFENQSMGGGGGAPGYQ